MWLASNLNCWRGGGEGTVGFKLLETCRRQRSEIEGNSHSLVLYVNKSNFSHFNLLPLSFYISWLGSWLRIYLGSKVCDASSKSTGFLSRPIESVLTHTSFLKSFKLCHQVHNCPPLNIDLSQLKPVKTLKPHFFTMHFPFTRWSTIRTFSPLCFLTKNLYQFLTSAMSVTSPNHLIPLYVHTLITFSTDYKLWLLIYITFFMFLLLCKCLALRQEFSFLNFLKLCSYGGVGFCVTDSAKASTYTVWQGTTSHRATSVIRNRGREKRLCACVTFLTLPRFYDISFFPLVLEALLRLPFISFSGTSWWHSPAVSTSLYPEIISLPTSTVFYIFFLS